MKTRQRFLNQQSIMEQNIPLERYLVLYLPWVVSLLVQGDDILSYFIAWLGSFLIFFLSLSGWLKPLPKDLKISEQLMRPIFLIQIIFAGYMACSSIFYFLSLLGWDSFHSNNDPFFFVDRQRIELTALCQRYYVLGHAALVTGMSVFMKYPVKKRYFVQKDKIANLLFVMAFHHASRFFVVFEVFRACQQFYFQFSSLSFMAGTLALAFAIPLGKIWNTASSASCFICPTFTRRLFPVLRSPSF